MLWECLRIWESLATFAKIMRREYFGLWAILVVSFIIFLVLSAFDTIKIGRLELRSSGMIEQLTKVPDTVAVVQDSLEQPADTVVEKVRTIDETPQTILFIGNSMLEGLSPRMAAYAEANGHTLYSVIWYSSTSEVWGESTKLQEYINEFKPTYVFISLGANELFVRNIAERRDKFVKNILSQVGDIPYVWIGPPNWKEDTGINDLIAKNARKGSFFVSNGMHFDRAKDGAHPTRKSAGLWLDSVARWMPEHAAHPIKMKKPEVDKSRPKRVIILQPKK